MDEKQKDGNEKEPRRKKTLKQVWKEAKQELNWKQKTPEERKQLITEFAKGFIPFFLLMACAAYLDMNAQYCTITQREIPNFAMNTPYNNAITKVTINDVETWNFQQAQEIVMQQSNTMSKNAYLTGETRFYINCYWDLPRFLEQQKMLIIVVIAILVLVYATVTLNKRPEQPTTTMAVNSIDEEAKPTQAV